MIPLWLRFYFQQAWFYLTFKYVVILWLCLWAFWIEEQYRMPGRFLYVLLPLVGLALGALNILVFVKHFLPRSQEENSFAHAFSKIERVANVLVIGFILYSVVLYINGRLDTSVPEEKASEILSLYDSPTNWGGTLPLSWMTFRSWDSPQGEEYLIVNWRERKSLWGGEAILLKIRSGFLGIPWVMGIDRDWERFAREILKSFPTAQGAWKKLLEFYLERHRLKEATATLFHYLEIYPDDYRMAYSIASHLNIAGSWAEAIPILEYVVAHHPMYEAYQSLGNALQQQAKYEMAIEILERSIPLAPDDWEVYFHLGEIYAGLGKDAAALAMYEEVLKRRPHFPRVQAFITSLRAKIAKEQNSSLSRESNH